MEQESINKKSLIPAKHVGTHICQGHLSISKLIKTLLFDWDAAGKSLSWIQYLIHIYIDILLLGRRITTNYLVYSPVYPKMVLLNNMSFCGCRRKELTPCYCQAVTSFSFLFPCDIFTNCIELCSSFAFFLMSQASFAIQQ